MEKGYKEGEKEYITFYVFLELYFKICLIFYKTSGFVTDVIINVTMAEIFIFLIHLIEIWHHKHSIKSPSTQRRIFQLQVNTGTLIM